MGLDVPLLSVGSRWHREGGEVPAEGCAGAGTRGMRGGDQVTGR